LRYVKVNETLANINGKPMIEHAGGTLFDVLPEEVAKKVEALPRRTIASGLPVTQEEVHGMIPHLPGKEHWRSVPCRSTLACVRIILSILQNIRTCQDFLLALIYVTGRSCKNRPQRPTAAIRMKARQGVRRRIAQGGTL
jgi:hypothetical protein